MLQKKNEGILFSAEIRVVGSYTDRLLSSTISSAIRIFFVACKAPWCVTLKALQTSEVPLLLQKISDYIMHSAKKDVLNVLLIS